VNALEVSSDLSLGRRVAPKRFQIGPSHDRDETLQLFSLLLDLAQRQSAHGKHFDVPFGALLRLANHNRPSLVQLELFCSSHEPGHDWPRALSETARHPADSASQEMLFILLRSALDSASTFEMDGTEVCRVLAAVGQTLNAKDKSIRESNGALAQTYRPATQQRISSPPPPAPREETPEIPADSELPGEMEFKRDHAQGGALRLNQVFLWHASYIGPALANKSENQDATFATAAGLDASPPAFMFALADGVSTSMGSRVAANAIVRRFCEFALPQIGSGDPAGVLVQAARQTQLSLDELAAALLETPNGYVFDAVRGSSLQSKAAIRILNNTLQPRASSIPAALHATLIAGIGQPSPEPGTYDIAVLRIGDGVVEHISSDGVVSAVLRTDPDVVEIAQALGPGPRSRELLETEDENLETCSIRLEPGEALIISSDGLVRGHQQSVTGKLSEILGPAFWKTTRTAGNETALDILRQACRSADELFEKDPQQSLFADNVSLILIRYLDL
jgi:Protein phosphatase 2C